MCFVVEKTPAAAPEVDVNLSIILNIEVEDGEAAAQETSQLRPEEATELRDEAETPKKKKKKSKKNLEAPAAGPPGADASPVEPSSDPPLSTKKKKRTKKRPEEVAEEEEEEEDISQVTSEKKAKKRKREREKVEEKAEAAPVPPAEPQVKKKRMKVRDVGEEQSGEVEEEARPEKVVTSEETPEKKKKKKKRKEESSRAIQEVQSDDKPAEGDKDQEETLEVTGRKSAPSSESSPHCYGAVINFSSFTSFQTETLLSSPRPKRKNASGRSQAQRRGGGCLITRRGRGAASGQEAQRSQEIKLFYGKMSKTEKRIMWRKIQ